MKLFKFKLLITMFMLSGMCNNLYAQNNGKITGQAKDAQTHEAISFATVALTNPTTKANIQATQTDANGNFTMVNLPSGTFTLRLSYLGYNAVVKENINISSSADVVNLGEVPMSSSPNKVLNEVTIIIIACACRSGHRAIKPCFAVLL